MTTTEGLFKWYGNWCGPDWTGGYRKSFDKLSSYEKRHVKMPIDAADSCCVTHDVCYAQCRKYNPCNRESRRKCMLRVDRELSNCLKRSKIHRVKVDLMISYMSSSSPNPGQNKSSCN